MPVSIAQRIGFHRGRAILFFRIARRRHFLAAVLARRSLAAKQYGYHRRAVLLIRRALLVKAAAARAAMRARFHRRRIGQLRMARRLHAQKQARPA